MNPALKPMVGPLYWFFCVEGSHHCLGEVTRGTGEAMETSVPDRDQDLALRTSAASVPGDAKAPAVGATPATDPGGYGRESRLAGAGYTCTV